MRERLTAYINYMDEISQKDLSDDQLKKAISDFLVQIQFFQNERLIHLLVTLGFAIITVMSLFCSDIIDKLPAIIFILGMLVFMFFYVRHYFFLERGVQKLYTYYDKLKLKEDASSFHVE